MTATALTLPAMALYLAAAILLAYRLYRGAHTSTAARRGILTLVAGAVVLHAALVQQAVTGPELNLSLTHMVSLVALAVAVLFMVAAVFQPVESLGVLILPCAALAVAAAWLWPGRGTVMAGASGLQTAHIIISLLAYSLLSIAVVQSLMLGLQERALHRRRTGGFLQNLPPLETMESLLFRMIAVGFLLLTFTVISGLFFSEEVFGKPLRLTHHILLSIIAWAVFAVLLAGRWRFGWRGRTAMRLTLTGFTLLVLGYFGTRFVLEVVLKR